MDQVCTSSLKDIYWKINMWNIDEMKVPSINLQFVSKIIVLSTQSSINKLMECTKKLDGNTY